MKTQLYNLTSPLDLTVGFIYASTKYIKLSDKNISGLILPHDQDEWWF